MKKKELNSMKLIFDGISANEAFARQTLCSFAAGLDPTLEELSDLRVVISEAVTNCVVHAYKNKGGAVEVSAKYFDDKSLKIKIKDRGCGISDIEKCLQPLYTTDESGERGGMGFAIMQAMSRKFRVRSKIDCGTVLYIEFKFS